MIQRVWNAYLVECMKAMRWKFTYLGPVLVIAMTMFTPFLQPGDSQEASSYGFIAFATALVLNLLGLLLILTYSASLVSSETSSGTIRLVLVRPILRHEFLLAKLLLGMTYAALITLLVAISTWSIGASRGNLSGVVYGGEMLYTSSQMATAYALGALVGLLPLFAVVAYALMISTLLRSSGAAVGAAIGVWIVFDTIKYPLHIAPLLFSSYLESPWQAFINRSEGLEASWAPQIYYLAATSFAAILVFTGVAVMSLRRRNIQA